MMNRDEGGEGWKDVTVSLAPVVVVRFLAVWWMHYVDRMIEAVDDDEKRNRD